MAELPTGTVTFLFTDIEGSTRDALGEPRMHELSARGEALDRDQASAYARIHVAEYLATLVPEAN